MNKEVNMEEVNMEEVNMEETPPCANCGRITVATPISAGAYGEFFCPTCQLTTIVSEFGRLIKEHYRTEIAEMVEQL